MNNLVVQLLLKTGTFSTDLKQAGGQIQSFKSGCQTAGKTLDSFGKSLGINIGSLTKLGTAAGVAVAAVKGFKGIMESTQTTSDALADAIAGAKGVVDAFARAIALADFSAFNNGLWSMYDAAKAARQALDDLQDAQAYYGFLSAENRTAFLTAQEGYRNPESTPAQKEQFLVDAQKAVDEGKELAKDLQAKTLENFQRQVVKWAGDANIDVNDVTFEQLRTVARRSLKENSESLANEYESGFNKFIADRSEYEKDFWEKSGGFWDKLTKKEYNNVDAVSKLQRDNAEIIAGRAIMQMKDEERNELLKSINYAASAEQAAISQQRVLDRLINSSTGGGGGGGSETEPIKESLEYWRKIEREAQKARDESVYMTAAWNDANTKLEEAKNKIELITATMERAKTNSKYGTEMLTPITGPNLTGQVTNTKTAGLAEDVVKEYENLSINELEEKIKKYTELAANVKGNTEQLSFYNNEIARLKGRVDELQSTGLPETKIPKETIDSWSEFNNAMSQTSTIVGALTNTFKESSEMTAASILSMVSTALPAIGSLIASIEALTATEAVEAGVAATGKAVSSSKHWIEAIAAVAALGATVAAALASARSQKTQRFASGGIVGGNSFTGDRVTANVNSGEMVLTKAQQARLFKLANGQGGGGQVEFHISGTELVGVLNNVNRKNKVIR